jgi:hypothetical protein
MRTGTRKERKQARKNKSIKVLKLTEEENQILWSIAKEMTLMPRDRSKDGKIFYENGRKGCYDYVGGSIDCNSCHYNFSGDGCLKWGDLI